MRASLNQVQPINRSKGRLLLIGLILIFALPAIIAKLILVQHWYQPGVSNKGVLIEPRLTYDMLSINAPESQNWHLGYVLPNHCEQLCQQQLHILKQSYKALGKYQPRVTPVLYIHDNSDLSSSEGFTLIHVDSAFTNRVHYASFVITDPLGQLVMAYPSVANDDGLVNQSKDLLYDFRKLLKLSRVG